MTSLYRNAIIASLSFSVYSLLTAAWLTAVCLPASGQVIRRTDLVTDDQSAHHAVIQDVNLKNVWGLSYTASGPFWVSNNGSGTSTLYSVNATTNIPAKVNLTANIPGDGSVTGQVFNPTASTGSFNHDTFLFVSEDGTISGWRGGIPGNNAEVLKAASSDDVYKGSALATISGHTYLYAANFKQGTIDILKGDTSAPTLTGNFVDPTIPTGYAPFNIQMLGGKLYVTYAQQDATRHDDVAGTGHGYVSVFDLNGNFQARVGSGGTLDSPWGLAFAPTTWGAYANDLLVGNFGDGHINVFDPINNTYITQLQDESHSTLVIDGLWALTPGNGGSAGNTNTIFFSAGPDNEAHGLFGSLQSVPEPGALALCLSLGILTGASFLRRRNRQSL